MNENCLGMKRRKQKAAASRDREQLDSRNMAVRRAHVK
jgi:hypothetical protein